MAVPAALGRSEPRSDESRFSSAPGVGAKRSLRVIGTESPRTGRAGSTSSVPSVGRASRPGGAIRARSTDGKRPPRCCRERRFPTWPSRPVCTSRRCSSTSGRDSGRRPPLGTAGVVRRRDRVSTSHEFGYATDVRLDGYRPTYQGVRAHQKPSSLRLGNRFSTTAHLLAASGGDPSRGITRNFPA